MAAVAGIKDGLNLFMKRSKAQAFDSGGSG